jgi:MYXO-CTERM domain-containing protein
LLERPLMLDRAARWIGAAAGLALIVLVSACGPAEPEPRALRAELSGDSPLVDTFRQAERESGVPAELLATIAEVQTRSSMQQAADAHDHDAEEHAHHAPREWGLMAIGTGGLTSLEVAAMLIGATPEQVASDARTNVRGAAALIAKMAHARGVDPSAGLDAWSPAIEAYGGDALWGEVRRSLARGWRGKDDDGFELRVIGIGLSDEIGVVSEALGYPGASWNPAYSGNYTNASRGASQINYIVIHTVQGSYAGCISWFKNSSSKVSAHYVVRSSDGAITQMVDDADIAWHDACFNSQTIGIEHEGYVSDPGKWYTDAMYAASAKLTAWLCDQYGIPKDRQHIMGHGEAPDCSTHTDPGPGWDWTKYMALVKNGGCVPKPEVCNGKDDDCDGQIDEGGVCNQAPKGTLDEVSCEAARGWAQDPDAPASSIDVHLYFGGPAGSGAHGHSLRADQSREDLCAAIGSCEHGFARRMPLSLLDGQPHAVHAYGIDSAGGPSSELGSSPKTLECPTPSASGVRRHVIDPDSLAAWKFDLFFDRLPLSDAQIAALPEGDPLPASPALVKSDDGAPEVWLVDGEHRRHVPDPKAMAEWRLAFGEVVEKPTAELNALELGPPLRAYPVLVLSSSGKLELVDDPFPIEPPPPPTGSGGSDGSWGGTSASGGSGSKSSSTSTQKTHVLDDDEINGSCACRQASPAANSHWWLTLALALPLVRRRRRQVTRR